MYFVSDANLKKELRFKAKIRGIINGRLISAQRKMKEMKSLKKERDPCGIEINPSPFVFCLLRGLHKRNQQQLFYS